MNRYLLMLNGGQEAHLDIEAWDSGQAIDIAKEKTIEGWDISYIRCESGEEIHRNIRTHSGRLIHLW